MEWSQSGVSTFKNLLRASKWHFSEVGTKNGVEKAFVKTCIFKLISWIQKKMLQDELCYRYEYYFKMEMKVGAFYRNLWRKVISWLFWTMNSRKRDFIVEWVRQKHAVLADSFSPQNHIHNQGQLVTLAVASFHKSLPWMPPPDLMERHHFWPDVVKHFYGSSINVTCLCRTTSTIQYYREILNTIISYSIVVGK